MAEEDEVLILPDTRTLRGCGCREWGLSAWRGVNAVTVEPILFCFVLAGVMTGTITTNLLLDKICKEEGYDEKFCANLTQHKTAEEDIQQRVTTLMMYSHVIIGLPSVLYTLFLGSWSDVNGRKLPMLSPLAGNSIAALLYMVNAYYKSLPSTYILLTAVPVALTGGMSTLLMACFSYISDITELRSRTTRIALVDLGFSLGSPVGLLLADYIYYNIGYVAIFAVSGLIYLFAFFYCLFRVRDSRGGSTTTGVQQRGSGTCGGVCDVANVQYSFATAFKRRPQKGRAKILLLIMAMCLLVFQFGSINLDYLYTKRMFSWTYNQYVHLSITKLLLQLIVSSVLLPVLSYKLEVEDSVLVVIGCVSSVCGTVMMAFAPSSWMLYLSAVISSIGVLPLVISRSLLSKVVPAEELGRIFSVLASFESIIPLASGPIYTALYNGTIHSFPGTIYLLSTGLYLVAGTIYVWVFLNRGAVVSAPDLPPTTHTHADQIDTQD